MHFRDKVKTCFCIRRGVAGLVLIGHRACFVRSGNPAVMAGWYKGKTVVTEKNGKHNKVFYSVYTAVCK